MTHGEKALVVVGEANATTDIGIVPLLSSDETGELVNRLIDMAETHDPPLPTEIRGWSITDESNPYTDRPHTMIEVDTGDMCRLPDRSEYLGVVAVFAATVIAYLREHGYQVDFHGGMTDSSYETPLFGEYANRSRELAERYQKGPRWVSLG